MQAACGRCKTGFAAGDPQCPACGARRGDGPATASTRPSTTAIHAPSAPSQAAAPAPRQPKAIVEALAATERADERDDVDESFPIDAILTTAPASIPTRDADGALRAGMIASDVDELGFDLPEITDVDMVVAVPQSPVAPPTQLAAAEAKVAEAAATSSFSANAGRQQAAAPSAKGRQRGKKALAVEAKAAAARSSARSVAAHAAPSAAASALLVAAPSAGPTPRSPTFVLDDAALPALQLDLPASRPRRASRQDLAARVQDFSMMFRVDNRARQRRRTILRAALVLAIAVGAAFAWRHLQRSAPAPMASAAELLAGAKPPHATASAYLLLDRAAVPPRTSRVRVSVLAGRLADAMAVRAIRGDR